MNDDVIYRQEAIDTLKRDEALVRAFGYQHAIEAIQALPSAEQKRERGRWERHYSRPNVFADLYWHCSCCGYKNEDQYANVYHKFCPHCGADMRGEEDD